MDVIAHPPGNLPEGVTVHLCDLDDRRALEKIIRGCDIVFHLAAKLHIINPSRADKEEYKKANVNGTRNVVETATSAGAKRLVFFSTINVYGSSKRGVVYDEASAANPESSYAQSKAEAESIVLNGLPCVVLRLAAVYGPRMKGNYSRLLKALRQGHFVMIGNGHNRKTLVHLRDVCGAAILAGEHPQAVGRIYNVTDGQVHTLKDIVAVICEALGKKPPRFGLPIGLVRPAFGLLEDGLRLVGRDSPLGRSTVDKLVEDLAVSGDKIRRELGFQPQVDLMSGWQEVVMEMSDENQIWSNCAT
jgi:UDP-glucose 4-epimerase